jgi:hypothetical protein
MPTRHFARAALPLAAVIPLVAAVAVSAASYTSWSGPVRAETLPGSASDVNTAKSDGCPIVDPYTNDLFIARPNAAGDLDIWRAKWVGNGWASPAPLGPSINTAGNEFCPTPARGNRLFFVRTPDLTMNGDMFVARAVQSDASELTYGPAERLPDPINSSAQEWSPAYYEEDDGTPVLYFSSTRLGSQDIFVSRNWGPPELAPGLNPNPATSSNDARPNVRRDGLEIVFDSDRPGGKGATDIWTSTRTSTSAPWNAPTPIAQLNSASGESRASLSWDGNLLLFGSARNGNVDVFVASRSRANGRQ